MKLVKLYWLLLGLLFIITGCQGRNSSGGSQPFVLTTLAADPTGKYVFLHAVSEKGGELAVLELSTGRLRWSKQLAEAKEFTGEFTWAESGDKCLYALRPTRSFGSLYELDVLSGRERTFDLQAYEGIKGHALMRLVFDSSLNYVAGSRMKGKAGPPNLVAVAEAYWGKLDGKAFHSLGRGTPVALAPGKPRPEGEPTAWLLFLAPAGGSISTGELQLTRLPDTRLRLSLGTMTLRAGFARQFALSRDGETGVAIIDKTLAGTGGTDVRYFDAHAGNGVKQLRVPDDLIAVVHWKDTIFFLFGRKAWLLEAKAPPDSALRALAASKPLNSKAACLLPDGRLLVANGAELAFLDASTGARTPWCDLAKLLQQARKQQD